MRHPFRIDRPVRAMLRGMLAFTVVAVLLGLSACSSGTASGPPEINYGRDVCDQCHMIISEARYAAAYRNAKGEPFVFDDIGDMMSHLGPSNGDDAANAWVHDYGSEEWIDVTDAWFVHSTDIETPMGGGTVAFTDRSDAERFAEENDGEVIEWAHIIDDIGNFSTSEGHQTHDDGTLDAGPDDEMTDHTIDDGEHGQ